MVIAALTHRHGASHGTVSISASAAACADLLRGPKFEPGFPFRYLNRGSAIGRIGFSKCTFSFEALLSEDADEREELCDLLQIKNGGVVELDDG